ncbi:MAG: beta-glucosidase [Sphaerochaetaceae bacterium]|nr:beta-glucosidase [Sphaerochaetaceae bacterium]
MKQRTFPQGFLFGTATASYQVEGAVGEGGRKASIWDTFSHTPGTVTNGDTGDIAVDQYHRYKDDIALMKAAGFKAYRFSIAWPRILPEGRGNVNAEGIAYYRNLIDELHAAGIEAVATLYHWDLPQDLEDTGGWLNRDTALRFAEYAEVCYSAFGSSIDMWITLNEPWCAAVLGYGTGLHAPGKHDLSLAWQAGYNLLYAHGLALQRYRTHSLNAPIGITLNIETPRPAVSRAEDREAVDKAMDMKTRFFLDPLLSKGFPLRHFASYPHLSPPQINREDLQLMAEKIDFLGLNYYYEHAISSVPQKGEKPHPEGFYEVASHHATTEMGWPVVPQGLYRQLKWVTEYTEGSLPLYITENGCAVADELSTDGSRCHDPERIAYLRSHLASALDAIEDGVPLKGYFAWSLIDNFEWAFGYSRRFGLIYADYASQERIPKDSYYYMREVIAGSESV